MNADAEHNSTGSTAGADVSATSTRSDGVATEAVDDPVGVLVRWEMFGGVWRVTERDGAKVTVSLCRCDGGEEQQRLVSADAALHDWLDGRTSNVATGA